MGLNRKAKLNRPTGFANPKPGEVVQVAARRKVGTSSAGNVARPKVPAPADDQQSSDGIFLAYL